VFAEIDVSTSWGTSELESATSKKSTWETFGHKRFRFKAL